MATLEELKDNKATSIHGRRLALDHDEQLMGPKGFKVGINSATSDTTGTNLFNYGINSVVTTTNDTWTLTDPVDNGAVTLMTGSSSTGTHTITCDNAVIRSTNGIAGASVILIGGGAAMSLVGVTTAIWAVTSRAGSSPSNYVSS